MSRPRFLVDHDLNEHILDGVLRREPSVEFVRARDVDLSDRPDRDVLEYAAANRLIVVSHDVNTMPSEAYARIRDGEHAHAKPADHTDRTTVRFRRYIR